SAPGARGLRDDMADTPDTQSSPDPSIRDFEAAIAELESGVKKLEEGDLPLEQSLALYERGVQLSRYCHARLEAAERRIEILTDRGELKAAPASLAGDGDFDNGPSGAR